MATNSHRSAFSLTRQALRRGVGRPSLSSSAPVARRSCSPLSTSTGLRTTNPFSPASSSSSTPEPAAAARTPITEAAAGGDEQSSRPRWSHTPDRMKAPFSVNIAKDPLRQVWRVNEDPAKLDEFYARLLGRDGDKMLPDELKWLAVTHKSFDQGRRGFNTRLAFFGRQVIALETTRSLLAAPAGLDALGPDPHGRQPFEHPALTNVDKLSVRQPRDILTPDRISRLCVDVGLVDVVRWKPRMPEKLQESGIKVVLNTTLFAIIGAISLQHGAEVASRVVRDKVLKRLGA